MQRNKSVHNHRSDSGMENGLRKELFSKRTGLLYSGIPHPAVPAFPYKQRHWPGTIPDAQGLPRQELLQWCHRKEKHFSGKAIRARHILSHHQNGGVIRHHLREYDRPHPAFLPPLLPLSPYLPALP